MTIALNVMTDKFVILGADSKSTVNYKTYAGEDKIFPLEKELPIGIMTYNLLTIGNLPIENLIEKYQRKTDFKKNNTIETVEKTFIEFLKKDCEKYGEDELKYLNSHIEEFEYFVDEHLSTIPENQRIKALHGWFDEEKNVLYEYFEKHSLIDEIPDEIFQETINKYFKTQDNKAEILSLLKKIYISLIFGTGIVISGFNKEEYDARHVSYVIYGLYNGELVYEKLDEEKYCGIPVIKSFAQNETINTFLTGINENHLADIENKLDDILKNQQNYILNMVKDIYNIPEKEINKLKYLSQNIGKLYSKDYMLKIKQIMNESLEEIKPYFGYVNENELSEIIEILIKLTEIRLKLSENLDTVGGEIKIAILSKIEGFKWMDKKTIEKIEYITNMYNKGEINNIKL